jgi:hypothetical protein
MNDPETHPEQATPSRVRWGLVALALYALALAVGIGTVALRDPVVATPQKPIIEEELDWSGDLARWETGAVARASSYHNRGQHHPIFAIDGVRKPDHLLSKWTSWPDDRAPWLAIDLPRATDIERVQIAHAGVREEGKYTVRDYQLVCLSDGREIRRQAILTDDPAVSTHTFECDAATTLRIEFVPGAPASPTGVVRIYEVEIYGGPSR